MCNVLYFLEVVFGLAASSATPNPQPYIATLTTDTKICFVSMPSLTTETRLLLCVVTVYHI